ncbi:hypothetical protein HDU81_006142 [Chytriomyces hyalinus]|nr:hypothetical protein HDU81_006142 [Chytriomyces hyalinus]
MPTLLNTSITNGNGASLQSMASPIRGTASAVLPQSTNPLARGCVDKAKEIHASIYSTSMNYKETVLAAYFNPAATFADPLVSVTGLHAVAQQYKFMTLFAAVSARINSVTWAHNQSTATSTQYSFSHPSDEVVVIDALIVFTLLPWLPPALVNIPIRTVSTFTFDSAGRVASHEDVWSIRDLIASMLGGLVGIVYDAFRTWNGTVSSWVIEYLVWFLAFARVSLLGAPKRTFSGLFMNRRDGTAKVGGTSTYY